eukprot:CAMPEP_0170075026 /NCGR_PEP_ID=MMETSP0019_2-20121128/12232_1 /TAXON_ID=98059 /ORGANISM="Dinobryon sp., Strain UTEXLB2267" /LENGTH=66 /DNA_ID=CAMNT_0010285721 /DNA_START=646 /DNA_END=846 /DNA_ORIENTATION=+
MAKCEGLKRCHQSSDLLPSRTKESNSSKEYSDSADEDIESLNVEEENAVNVDVAIEGLVAATRGFT